jgi:hypothetical protein
VHIVGLRGIILFLLPNHQMVNTRNSQCNGQPSNNNSNNNVNLEQLITTQNQLMQAVLQTLNNMQSNQQAHQQQAPPPPPSHQSRLAEFLRTRPTTFAQAKDPIEAEDWLKGVEKKLVIASARIARRFFLSHTSSLVRQQIGGRHTVAPMQMSTPSRGMSSRLVYVTTMYPAAP